MSSKKEILKKAEKNKNNEQEISEDKKEITPDESNLEIK